MATQPTSNLDVQNWFQTTLSAQVGPTDTTINLNAVPTPTEGYLIIDPDNVSLREVIHYTNTTSSTVTLPGVGDRGLDGGSAATTHAQNAVVRMEYTTSHFDALKHLYATAAASVNATLLGNNSVLSANLGLSAALTGGVASIANGGTAGGTLWYINLGGLKALWGQLNAMGDSTTGNNYTVNFPSGFFSTAQMGGCFPGVGMGTVQHITLLSALSATQATVTAAALNGSSTSVTGFIWAIGT